MKFRAFDDDAIVTQESSGLTNYQILQRFSIVDRFSGLNDRNGIEIYENDIVEYTGHTGGIPAGYCMPSYLAGQTFIVNVLLSGFTLTIPEIFGSKAPSQVGHVSNYDFWNHHKSLLVVGNTHTNIKKSDPL